MGRQRHRCPGILRSPRRRRSPLIYYTQPNQTKRTRGVGAGTSSPISDVVFLGDDFDVLEACGDEVVF